MTVNISPELLKRFQAHRVVLTVLKNNGGGGKPVSHNDVMEYLFSHSPLTKEVEKYMEKNEATLKAIAESQGKTTIKGMLK